VSHRFFVPSECVSGDRIAFTEYQRKQIKNVLRLDTGEIVYTLDNTGREYVTRIETLDGSQAIGRITEVRFPATEPKLRMSLVQSMPKGERLDLILQKCTEIGVSEFLIIETERTIVRISPDKTQARLERWRAIVREAAEQSGRALLPVVEGVSSFCEAMARAAQQPAMIAWEGERSTSLLTALQELGGNELTLFIGPEGGFTTEEVDAARSLGIVPVSLGPRILRTETAAIVASALAIFVTANWKYA